jgi:DNA-binding protein H-NS
MSVDELWALYEVVARELGRKIKAHRSVLEDRLRFLGEGDRPKRSYQKLLPKYRNPSNPSETWTGRGKQPRWLTAQIRSGKELADFLIG